MENGKQLFWYSNIVFFLSKVSGWILLSEKGEASQYQALQTKMLDGVGPACAAFLSIALSFYVLSS